MNSWLGFCNPRPSHHIRHNLDGLGLTMKILVADDHKLVREMTATLLRNSTCFDVHCSGDLPDTMKEIQENGPFGVILLDLMMPGMNGLNALPEVIASNAPGKVALFSGTTNHQAVHDAIELGASGFLPKTLSPKALINAINLISDGEVFVPAQFNQSLNELDANNPLSSLKAIERTILRQLRIGATNKEIARSMEMTEVNVKMHVRSICMKLGVKNRTQAAVQALHLKLD